MGLFVPINEGEGKILSFQKQSFLETNNFKIKILVLMLKYLYLEYMGSIISPISILKQIFSEVEYLYSQHVDINKKDDINKKSQRTVQSIQGKNSKRSKQSTSSDVKISS